MGLEQKKVKINFKNVSLCFQAALHMELYEKYPKLSQKSFVTQMITSIVGSSMALENQAVPEPQIQALVIALLRESELKGREFRKNQFS